MAAGMMLLAACQEEEFGYTATEITYETEFVKTFGTPDANHTWSMLRDVTLTTDLPLSGEYNLYVTTRRPGLSDNCLLDHCVRQLEGGTMSYTFSVPRGLERAYVTAIPVGANMGYTQSVLLGDNEANPVFDGQPVTSNASAFAPEQLTAKMNVYIAFEDLGGKCDWDFNDVVLKTSLYTDVIFSTVIFSTLNIELLAVGGTLPVSLKYGEYDVEFGENKAKELHEAFGCDSVDYRVNVNPGTDDDPALFVVSQGDSPNWTYPLFQNPTTTMAEALKSLTLCVNNQTEATGVRMISADQTKNPTPQALIVVMPDDCTWTWPDEGQNIGSLYPAFKDWVADQNHQNWYEWGFYHPTTENSIPEGEDDDKPLKAQGNER